MEAMEHNVNLRETEENCSLSIRNLDSKGKGIGNTRHY
jgi:hypothetical protein